jgi:1,4-alpha-glucan branching enzyme
MKPKKQTKPANEPPKIAVVFKLCAPEAVAVQLAGDFTGWDASPLPLERNSNDLWYTEVRLNPGRHEYRFLVDGQWQNDPACSERIENAFGSSNNVIELK